MSTTAILVAAGVGERFGADQPKAYALLAGEPLLVHAARSLMAAQEIDQLVVVVAPDCRARAEHALARAGLTLMALVDGGATRSASVRAGLAIARDEVVAVHDAARPLVSAALVDHTVRMLDRGAGGRPWAAVAPALPVVDTLKLVEPSQRQVLQTLDRRGLWAVQTPQVFRRELLAQVHARVGAEASDDLALVELAGGRVHLVEGERRNLKITFPQDLALAEAILTTEGR